MRKELLLCRKIYFFIIMSWCTCLLISNEMISSLEGRCINFTIKQPKLSQFCCDGSYLAWHNRNFKLIKRFQCHWTWRIFLFKVYLLCNLSIFTFITITIHLLLSAHTQINNQGKDNLTADIRHHHRHGGKLSRNWGDHCEVTHKRVRV